MQLMVCCAGRWKGDRKWYSGTIESYDASDDEYMIKYVDGVVQTEPLKKASQVSLDCQKPPQVGVPWSWLDEPVQTAARTIPHGPPSVRFDSGEERTVEQGELKRLVPEGKVACVCLFGVASDEELELQLPEVEGKTRCSLADALSVCAVRSRSGGGSGGELWTCPRGQPSLTIALPLTRCAAWTTSTTRRGTRRGPGTRSSTARRAAFRCTSSATGRPAIVHGPHRYEYALRVCTARLPPTLLTCLT